MLPPGLWKTPLTSMTPLPPTGLIVIRSPSVNEPQRTMGGGDSVSDSVPETVPVTVTSAPALLAWRVQFPPVQMALAMLKGAPTARTLPLAASSL